MRRLFTEVFVRQKRIKDKAKKLELESQRKRDRARGSKGLGGQVGDDSDEGGRGRRGGGRSEGRAAKGRR